MFSTQAQVAYSTLQKISIQATEGYVVDRAERALDEILRNPSNANPASHQVRSAWANAAKVLKNRRELAPVVTIDTADGAVVGVEPSEIEGGYGAVEILDWLDHAHVSSADRLILRGLALGDDAHTLSDVDGVPVQRMRERISRARRAASMDYRSSGAAA